MKNQKNINKSASAATSRPLVYICSPYRPVSENPVLVANELIGNLKLARDAAALATFRGYKPIAPHLYYPQFLNDDDQLERELGMELGMLALARCSELWIVSARISSGMSTEIKRARELGIPVLVFTTVGLVPYTGDGEVTDNCVC